MRRDPSSDEGRRIVEAILEAGERLLREGCFTQLSSNRIAEAAGVSIGSFYQYFPNKESVLAALAQALDRRTLELLRVRADRIARASTKDAVQALIDILFDARMGGLALRRQLLVHVPRNWIADESARVDREAQTFVCNFLKSRELDLPNPEATTFVLFHTVEAVVEAAVASRPDLIADGTLRLELGCLVLGYLGVAPEPPTRRKSAPPGELRLPS